jgi:peptidoglycan/LPS O-acetylase OafA/YrhL
MPAAVLAPSLVNEKTKEHRKDIDGLRAIAVLAVLGYHCKLQGLSGGFVGVDVFFVISGYLICALIVRDLDRDRFSIARFYERRCKRILPALFAILLFCLIVAICVGSPYEASQVGKSVMAAALSLSNVFFYRQGNYFDQGGILSPLLMTWSLAVEEQFYLFFPLLMLLLYKRSKKHIFIILSALCTASLLFSIAIEHRHPGFNFYFPFTRAWEIGAGALLAFCEARQSGQTKRRQWQEDALSWIGLALVFGSIVFYSPAVRFPGFEAIPPVLGTVLVLANMNGRGNRLLALPPLVGIGLISYSLYLWHWPLLSFVAMIDPVPIDPKGRVLLMGIAFIVAIVSYFLIERPFRTRAARSTSRVLLAYASGISCIFLFGAIFYFTRGIPQRAPELAAIEGSLNLNRDHTCFSRGEGNYMNLTPDCVPPASSVPVIALLGDSHAEALQPVLKDYATAHGYHLLILAMAACPPLKEVTRYRFDDADFADECRRFNERTERLVANRPDVKIVLLTGRWPMTTADDNAFLPIDYRGDPMATSTDQRVTYLLQGIRAEIHEFEAAGKRVILVEDTPSLTFNPLDRYRYAHVPIRHFIVDSLLGHPIQDASSSTVARSLTITPGAEKLRTEMLELGQADSELTVIDTTSIFCNQTVCTFSDGKNLYYTDENHVSDFGATKIISNMESASKIRTYVSVISNSERIPYDHE